MISQKCPRCDSGRVRRGYKPTPILMRLIGRYNLLCDNCNWEFVGFAVPGTTSAKPTKRPRSESSSQKAKPGSSEKEGSSEKKENKNSGTSGAAMMF